MVALPLLLFVAIPCAMYGYVDTTATGMIDRDCKGGYGSWSVCEPFEGHDTHHDPDDTFDMKRAADGHYIGECFQFRTYHILIDQKGMGHQCSKTDGSKLFRYCSDCSSIPDVRKRLENGGPQHNGSSGDQGLKFLAGVAGIFCLIATVIFGILCMKKMFDSPPEQRDIPFYPPSIARSAIGATVRPSAPQMDGGCIVLGKVGDFGPNPVESR